jgi:hypothetical protein
MKATNTYHVTVHSTETVYYRQVLEVSASSPQEAEEICDENCNSWRNGKDCAEVTILAPEEIVDAETEAIDYEIAAVRRTAD